MLSPPGAHGMGRTRAAPPALRRPLLRLQALLLKKEHDWSGPPPTARGVEATTSGGGGGSYRFFNTLFSSSFRSSWPAPRTSSLWADISSFPLLAKSLLICLLSSFQSCVARLLSFPFFLVYDKLMFRLSCLIRNYYYVLF